MKRYKKRLVLKKEIKEKIQDIINDMLGLTFIILLFYVVLYII